MGLRASHLNWALALKQNEKRMIIDDIVDSIDSGGPKGYYAFETFVNNLLKHHIEKNNKKYIVTDERQSMTDGLAPEGFDEFSGKTLIEIKFRPPSSKGLVFFLTKFTQRFCNEVDELPCENLVFIFAKNVSPPRYASYTETIDRLKLPFKVVIWGPKDLNKIVSKNKKVTNEIASNLFSLRLESAISKPNRDWKSEREETVLRLKESYKRGQFSLFLGAGVSSSAGMPDWNTLLNSLFVSYLTREFDEDTTIDNSAIQQLVSRLNTLDEPSALMAARYLRKGLSKHDSEAKEFIRTVTNNLYGLRDTEFDIDSRLIKSISALCQPRRTGAKVNSVVTYNFDDLLERQLSISGIMYNCIYTDSESYDPDELPIYHVHGFLPEERSCHEGLDKSTLVFSEEGYHHIYSDSYHWSNLVQLNSFRENNCLMVGLSMTDPNLRRLLDISSKNIERSKHFAFMKRQSTEEFCFKKESNKKVQLIDDMKSADKFLDRHHRLNEELMRELGVTVIWYEKYDDIPEILERIAQY